MNEVWKKPPLSLEAYQNMVGREIGVSSWHVVDQGRINAFADVIEDHQFIHVDPERAKRETAFGSTVAHGFLTMSLLSIMSYEVMPVIEGTTMGVNYGFDKLRFISPVRAGSRVRGRFTLILLCQLLAQAAQLVTQFIHFVLRIDQLLAHAVELAGEFVEVPVELAFGGRGYR